mgnify:CR=1 FL=1
MNSPPTMIVCDKHKKEVSFLCAKDNELICGICAIKDHSSHIQEIKEITVDQLKKHSTLLSGHLDKIEDHLRKLK